jgi:hypothetical protein
MIFVKRDEAKATRKAYARLTDELAKNKKNAKIKSSQSRSKSEKSRSRRPK